MFSAVFYLWATEALQRDAVERNIPEGEQPLGYAAESIRAAVNLIADPGHATWVRQHWGEAYLDREAIMLFMFTRQPMHNTMVVAAERRPPLLVFVIPALLGTLCLTVLALALRRCRIQWIAAPDTGASARAQALLWCLLVGGGVTLMVMGHGAAGWLGVFLGQLFPR